MIVNIQALRAIAVILVILNHAAQQCARVGPNALSFELGSAGVDIFFVISGFIMCHITDRGARWSTFIASRFLRIAPTYYLVTLAMAATIIVAPNLFKTSTISPLHLASSFAFIAWPHPVMGDAIPLYLPGWTLNYEFFFYVLFSLFLWTNIESRIVAVTLILLAFAIARILFPDGPIFEFYTNSIVLEFAFGMLVFLLIKADMIFSPKKLAFLLVAACVLIIVLQSLLPTARGMERRFIVWGLPSALFVYAAIALEKHGRTLTNTVVRLIGNASYAIYLSHLFTIGLIAVIWTRLRSPPLISNTALLLTCLGASLAVGILFHFYVERPINRLSHRLLNSTARRRETPKTAEY